MIRNAKEGDRVRVKNQVRDAITFHHWHLGEHTWDFTEQGYIGIVTSVWRRHGSLFVNVRPENSDDHFPFTFVPSSLVRIKAEEVI